MGDYTQDLTEFYLSQKLDKPVWCYWNHLGQSNCLKIILTKQFVIYISNVLLYSQKIVCAGNRWNWILCRISYEYPSITLSSTVNSSITEELGHVMCHELLTSLSKCFQQPRHFLLTRTGMQDSHLFRRHPQGQFLYHKEVAGKGC